MKLQIIRMEVIMEDYILLDEDFKNFAIGEFPYDKNHSAMGEYHFIHYPGYYGKWYDPVCNHTYNGQGASWIITEYNGKHYMEQMRIRNDKPHRTFPMLTSGDRFWRDYTITASVRSRPVRGRIVRKPASADCRRCCRAGI